MPKLGKKQLEALTARDVRQLLAGLATNGVGARTAQLAHAVLRAALEDAMREESSPATSRSSSGSPPETKEREPLTSVRCESYLSRPRPSAVGDVRGLRSAGVRRSEALGLRWEDIDLNRASCGSADLHRVDGTLAVLPTKTLRSARTIPLPAMVTRALKVTRPARSRTACSRRPVAEPRLRIYDSDRHPNRPRNCTRIVQNECQAAGCRRSVCMVFSMAALRFFLALGVPPRTVMAIVGHSTIEMTMNVYGHVSIDDQLGPLSTNSVACWMEDLEER